MVTDTHKFYIHILDYGFCSLLERSYFVPWQDIGYLLTHMRNSHYGNRNLFNIFSEMELQGKILGY